MMYFFSVSGTDILSVGSKEVWWHGMRKNITDAYLILGVYRTEWMTMIIAVSQLMTQEFKFQFLQRSKSILLIFGD